jgi:hypothetical protein
VLQALFNQSNTPRPDDHLSSEEFGRTWLRWLIALTPAIVELFLFKLNDQSENLAVIPSPNKISLSISRISAAATAEQTPGQCWKLLWDGL